MPVPKPEVLAPAGDEASLRAAVAAGADAVYFGLKSYSARARAENFDQDNLRATQDYLHRHGRKGYVALNTLVFDDELDAVEAAVRRCAEAGVDALIVQDLGVARIAQAVAPSLPIHASTQMTCTDAGAIELAREIGASRVILARELSIDDIARISASSNVELEVFVHGALCVAYSGQCMTSEAIGGRSANRGACAQACRLPYELWVDGERRDTKDKAFLLSPQDLEAAAIVPRLVELGIQSLKIEGRLKGPDYVYATTRLYREAVDRLAAPTAEIRAAALQTFSRGSGPGFLGGTDHQHLVDGETCDHRGVFVAIARGVRDVGGRRMLVLDTTEALARGDGVLVQGGYAGQGEIGGRIWTMRDERGDVENAPPGSHVFAWLGPQRELPSELPERRVFRTSSPGVTQSIEVAIRREVTRVPLDVVVTGSVGAPLALEGRTADGRTLKVATDVVLARAQNAPLTVATLRQKMGKLGETPYALRDLDASSLPDGVIVPLSSLNRARRALTAALDGAGERHHTTTGISAAGMAREAMPPDRSPPPAGLFVLARNLAQAEAALDAGASGVYLDFLELVGTGAALRALRQRPGAWIGVAPPRIRKPNEEKIDRYLRELRPDAILVRGLGALREVATCDVPCIGDFSLNVTNRLSAAEVLGRGTVAFTPAFDLDELQLQALARSPLGPFAEVVVHHPMPLFHMEHCVFAAMLSNGSDHRTCGRPCERHAVSLRDRAGVEHPIVADVGCRNTVFHGRSQSAVTVLPALKAAGVARFRIELVRETPADVAEIVRTYAGVLSGAAAAVDAWRALRSQIAGGYDVVRGSLRVVG